MIELGQRIRNAEVVVEIFENLRRAFERVTPPLGLALCSDDANLRAGCFRFDQIQLAGDENIQVTRHRRRWCEAHFFPIVDFALAFDRHVRNGEPVFRNDSCQLKSRAKTGFVPTREKAPRIRRLELGAERNLFRARTLLLIAHVEKPASLLVDFAGKTKREHVRSRRKLRWKCDREQLVFIVDLDRAFRNRFVIDRGIRNFDFKRIEHQLAHGTAHIELHRFCSGEGELVDVRNDSNGILKRDNLLRQFSRSAFEVEWFFGGQFGSKNK